MSHHIWGDKTFDWHGLNEAIHYIDDFCTKYGFIQVTSKEKWGQADIYVYWWDGTIWSLFYTSRWWKMSKKWPGWLRSVDFKLGDLLTLIGVRRLVHAYQQFIYKLAYDRALNRWPHLKEEIVGGMAEWEVLEKVMVKHQLTKQYRGDDCHAGKHTFSKHNYCSKCYVTPIKAIKEQLEHKEESDHN